MNSMKRQKDMTLEDEPTRSEGVQYDTEEEQRSSSKKKKKKIRGWAKVEITQLQMCLVVKVKSDSVKNDTEWEPGMLSP